MIEEKQIEQKESVKLMKMSKGYQWEIKLLGDIDDKQLERLGKINQDLERGYGNNENTGKD